MCWNVNVLKKKEKTQNLRTVEWWEGKLVIFGVCTNCHNSILWLLVSVQVSGFYKCLEAYSCKNAKDAVLALHWCIDQFSIRKKLMIVHKTKSTAFGFSPAFPCCKISSCEIYWLALETCLDLNWGIWNPGMSCNVKLLPLKWVKNACLSSIQTHLSQKDQSCTGDMV